MTTVTGCARISLRATTVLGHYLAHRARQMTGPNRPMGVLAVSKKLPSLVAALALVLALPGLSIARTDHATLIDVHAMQVSHARPGSGANCSNDGQTHGQYALTGWAVAGTTTAHLTTSTIPSGLATSGVLSALQSSFNAWTGAPTINVTGNGTVTKYTANHSYDLLWGRTGGSSIAVTYTWRWSNGSIESDTVFNSRLPWALIAATGDGCNEAVAKYDVANIATHEFGHTYGLGHANSDRFETMYPYGYTGETLKRSPADGDRAGINAVY